MDVRGQSLPREIGVDERPSEAGAVDVRVNNSWFHISDFGSKLTLWEKYSPKFYSASRRRGVYVLGSPLLVLGCPHAKLVNSFPDFPHAACRMPDSVGQCLFLRGL